MVGWWGVGGGVGCCWLGVVGWGLLLVLWGGGGGVLGCFLSVVAGGGSVFGFGGVRGCLGLAVCGGRFVVTCVSVEHG
ncbi:hypothetical protein RA273_28010, partial [Pseudomonas syringae pv. tagetis]